MQKTKVNLTDCEIGHILARDIFSDKGILLATKNTVINSFILLKLQEIGIGSVCIYDVKDSEYKSLDNRRYEAFKSNYFETVLFAKEMLNGLASGQRLKPDQIMHFTEHVFKYIDDADCVISDLNRLKNYDDYTYYHSVNVAFYAMLIGKWSHLPKKEIIDLILSGCLHDLGKIRVSNDILNKTQKLTDFEFEEIKRHSVYGYMMIKDDANVKNDVKEAVLSHHERFDGSGYPTRASGQSICKYAKIIAIADVYDAMTSERVYKRRETPFEAFRMFSTIGASLFDPFILKIFLTNMAGHMSGLSVQLSDGRIGEVVYVPYYDTANPVVCIDSSFIDMSRNTDLKIEDVV